MHVLGQVLLHDGHALMHGIGYVYVVGTGLGYHHNTHHGHAVHLHVALYVASREFGTTYVAEAYYASFGLLDDQVVELLGGGHLSHGADTEFTGVALDRA